MGVLLKTDLRIQEDRSSYNDSLPQEIRVPTFWDFDHLYLYIGCNWWLMTLVILFLLSLIYLLFLLLSLLFLLFHHCKSDGSHFLLIFTQPTSTVSQQLLQHDQCKNYHLMEHTHTRQACLSQFLRRVWRPVESGCEKSNGQIEYLPGHKLPMWCIYSPPVYIKTSLDIIFFCSVY